VIPKANISEALECPFLLITSGAINFNVPIVPFVIVVLITLEIPKSLRTATTGCDSSRLEIYNRLKLLDAILPICFQA
jgi:hypothetical protein